MNFVSKLTKEKLPHEVVILFVDIFRAINIITRVRVIPEL